MRLRSGVCREQVIGDRRRLVELTAAGRLMAPGAEKTMIQASSRVLGREPRMDTDLHRCGDRIRQDQG